MEIPSNFLALSEYMNFNKNELNYNLVLMACMQVTIAHENQFV